MMCDVMMVFMIGFDGCDVSDYEFLRRNEGRYEVGCPFEEISSERERSC